MKADENFQRVLKAIARGAPPLRIKASELLGNYSQSNPDGTQTAYKKRGSGIVAFINRSFGKLGVEAYPRFENVRMEEHVEIRKRRGTTKQVYLSIESIEAARKPARTVDQFEKAESIHMLLSTGQEKYLVVIDENQEPIGIVGWEHIAKHLIRGNKATHAKDYLNNRTPSKHSRDEKLLDLIDTIQAEGVILIDRDESLGTSVVTIHDVAKDFVMFSEAFHLIGEIEWRVRVLLIEKINPDEATIREWASPTAKYKLTAKEVWDLSFGELVNQFNGKTLWEKLGVQLDRETFYNRLRKVNTLRNEVFHFRPNTLAEEEMEHLRQTCKLMESLTLDEVET